MLQLCWNPSTRQAEVLELPPPHLEPGFIRVRNRWSIISAGTEKSNTQLSLTHPFKIMRERPDLVLKVKRLAHTQGLRRTWEMVQNRISVRQAVGYSCAGVVEAVGDDSAGIGVGDRVACTGTGYAIHAEQVLIPYQLCAAVPPGCDWEAAAMGALGAIAMQSFRLTQATVGEKLLVIGLGLVGQLCARIALAAGCVVAGVDPDAYRGGLLKAQGATAIWTPESAPASADFDAVIVAAASDSAEPLALAARLVRARGHVVATGLVPLTLPRDLYYQKEIEFVVSRSTGPGRYDPSYEELGIDYPRQYVRWTEQRNLASFLELAAQQRLAVGDLITHRFPIADGVRAYGKMLAPEPRQLGLAIGYDNELSPHAPTHLVIPRPKAAMPIAGPRLALIGAGRFATSVLLPALTPLPLQRAIVCTRRPLEGRNAAEKFGFARLETDPNAIFVDPEIDAVIVATRHDSHAALIRAALAAGKAVFAEKPLAITPAQMAEVASALQLSGARLLVGFNRRFAPLTEVVRRHFAGNENRLVVHYRINAGFIPIEDWTQIPSIGGGRTIGEVCHFIDWVSFLCASLPASVYAVERRDSPGHDEIVLTLSMENGSVAVITYVSSGASALTKERIEIFGAGRSAVLDDWQSAELFNGSKRRRVQQPGKGHSQELAAWVAALRTGAGMPIAPESLLRTTAATFAVARSLAERRPQRLECEATPAPASEPGSRS